MKNKVYVIKDKNNVEYHIPSMEYVEYITSNIDKPLGTPSYDEIDVVPSRYPAAQLEEDSNHRTLSDSLIEYLRSKPSLHEMADMISNSKDEMRTSLDTMFLKLLNMNDAVTKLRAIADFISADTNLSSLLESLTRFVSREEMTSHIKDNTHITKNDKENLILLKKMMDDKLIDRILESHVKKANEALDSKTLNGVDPSDVLHRHHGTLVGTDELYTANQVDALLSGTENNNSHFFITGLYNLALGKFPFKDLHLNQNYTVICGEGEDTILSLTGSNNLIDKTNIRDIRIASQNDNLVDIKLGGDCNIHDTVFENCNISFTGTNIIITNCRFKNCKFTLDRNGYRIILAHNIFLQCDAPQYVGGHFVTKGNIDI